VVRCSGVPLIEELPDAVMIRRVVMSSLFRPTSGENTLRSSGVVVVVSVVVVAGSPANGGGDGGSGGGIGLG
jgi:hypothetical protein